MLTQRENEILDELFEDIFPEERHARASEDTSSPPAAKLPLKGKPQKEGLQGNAERTNTERTNTVRPYDRGCGSAERLFAPWTDEEDAYIIDARKRGETAHETARKLNRTEQGVYARRKALGVSRIPSERKEKKTRMKNRFSLDTTRESGFINEEFDKCFEDKTPQAAWPVPTTAREPLPGKIAHTTGRTCTVCGTEISIAEAVYCYICGTSLLTEREKLIADVAKAKKENESEAMALLLERVLTYLRKEEAAV